MIEQVEQMLPEGTDPAEFWASLSEAILRMQEGQQENETHEEAATATVPAHPVFRATPVLDVINAARFEIDAIEGGRYGEVSVTPVEETTDTTVVPDPTAGVTASGSPRKRARRSTPSVVAAEVLDTMEAVLVSEVQAGVKLADSHVSWVIENPRYPVTNIGYRHYNSRDLMADVFSLKGRSYTKAQLRTALKRLITSGHVVENGKNSKATRYTLVTGRYQTLVKNATKEND